jgi:hypothetical protein
VSGSAPLSSEERSLTASRHVLADADSVSLDFTPKATELRSPTTRPFSTSSDDSREFTVMGIRENDPDVIVVDFEVRHMVEFEGGAWHAPPGDC